MKFCKKKEMSDFFFVLHCLSIHSIGKKSQQSQIFSILQDRSVIHRRKMTHSYPTPIKPSIVPDGRITRLFFYLDF